MSSYSSTLYKIVYPKDTSGIDYGAWAFVGDLPIHERDVQGGVLISHERAVIMRAANEDVHTLIGSIACRESPHIKCVILCFCVFIFTTLYENLHGELLCFVQQQFYI